MKNHSISVGRKALWVAAILALGVQAQAKIVMSPYLQAVTDKSICVMVECDSKDPVTVEYGLTAKYGKKATTESSLPTDAKPAPTYVHRVNLTGLLPGATYHYRATQDGKDFSTDAAFVTAVPAGRSIRFAALGDFRTNTAIHEAIAAKIKVAKPMFSIYGGDLAGNGSYELYKKEFFQPNELALDACVPFFNSPGNHEGWGTNTKAFTQPPASPKDAQGYYSFDYGDVHFVGINNQTSYAEGSPQWKFVSEDLAATKKPWKVVFFHEPAYCAGGHNENKNMINMTTKLFEPNKVDIVIAGHTHLYQHNLVNGIHHFVLGSAGAPLYDPGKADYVVKTARAYHYAIIDVDKGKFHMVVYKDDGSVLDTLDLTKGASAAPAVPAKSDWTTTPSGLKYKDEKVGQGPAVKATDFVEVRYKGWLDDGTVFDSNMDESKQAFWFTVGAGEVIKGWDEGLVGMKAGGIRELEIPSDLGYGARGAGGVIPPNAKLHFQVKLVTIGV